MRADVDRSYLSNSGSVALWYAFLGAPICWFAEQLVNYPAVPFACSHKTILPLLIINLVGMALTIGSGVVAYSIWNDVGPELPGEHATRTDRTRMMAVIGMMFSGLFTAVVVGHFISILVLGPCIPLPRVRYTPDALSQPAQTQLLASTSGELP
jgi:hypothetical protein